MQINFLLLLTLTLVSGCNSLFYYPDKANYSSPQMLGLSFRELEIPSSDGVILHAWKINADHNKKGTVVQFHGNAQNMSSHVLSVAWLARNGYAVVTFDYRGYGKSNGNPSRAGLVEDGVSILRYCAQDPVLSKHGLIVLGQSLGGAVAVPAIALSPDEVKKAVRLLILDSTFASYRDVARNKLASFWLTWPLQWPLSLLVSDEYSPEDYLRDLDVPLLEMHAEKDPVVPFQQGQALYSSSMVKTKTFWQIPGTSHTRALTTSFWQRELLSYLSAQNAPTQPVTKKASLSNEG